ncbi:type II secretion system F family protein [Streptacidiphilus jiangxiensis]|uniref:Tight adherence protein B n=1 Tax=Streptacidiphilus jiangxiensis TaxID=235985 RepID=A0A1H7PVE0_STRJI|nr:type II secretion system F family protein [Streptacidiphilus jiangxiensis]SEL39438.1 tight adherence protein B [Streptacidiphilus jiangxiensis]
MTAMAAMGTGPVGGGGGTSGPGQAELGLVWPSVHALATAAVMALLGLGAWWLTRRDRMTRRLVRLCPGVGEQRSGAWRRHVHRMRALLPVELLLLPLGAVSAWLAASPVPALVAAAAVWPTIRLRRRRRALRAREDRQAAVVELCAALAGELRTGATPYQAVEMAVEGLPHGDAIDSTALLAAVRLGGSVDGALTLLAETPGAEGARGAAACWRVTSASGAGLAEGLDRVAEGLRSERALRDSVRAELAGPRSTAVLLALLPVFGLALGAALGADPLQVLLHTTSGLVCLLVGGLLEYAGLVWTARIARAAERTA